MEKKQSPKSIRLRDTLRRRGYPADFCILIARECNTDWTAQRMLGYLSHYKGQLPMEDVVDEMLAILSDRERIVEKKKMEYTQARWNMHLTYGLNNEEDDL